MLRYPHGFCWSRWRRPLIRGAWAFAAVAGLCSGTTRAESIHARVLPRESKAGPGQESRLEVELPDVVEPKPRKGSSKKSRKKKPKNSAKSAKKTNSSAKNPARTNKKLPSRSNPKQKAKGSKSESKFVGESSTICNHKSPVYRHTVVSGEHLGKISAKYGVTRKDIAAWNPQYKNLSQIKPGQMLNICPKVPPRKKLVLQHVVEKGESLASIAAKHDLTLKALLAMQSDKQMRSRYLRIGEKVRIMVEGEHDSAFLPKPKEQQSRSKSRYRYMAGHRLPKSSYYRFKRPHTNYGTETTVRAVQKAIRRYHRRAKGPQLLFGDLSKRGGGPIRGHRSHRRGIDVDIGLVVRGQSSKSLEFERATFRTLDVRRTWILLDELIKTGQVRYIFLDHRLQRVLYRYAKRRGVSQKRLSEYFQYPRSRKHRHGIIRHWRGHDDHMHIRFRQ